MKLMGKLQSNNMHVAAHLFRGYSNFEFVIYVMI